MIEKDLLRTAARHSISDDEEAAIRALVRDVREFPARTTFVHAGERVHHSTMLLDGLMCRYKNLESGQRQIAELHVAGDFADLHSFSLKRPDRQLSADAKYSVRLFTSVAFVEVNSIKAENGFLTPPNVNKPLAAPTFP